MPQESDYKPMVKGAIERMLRDPDSARFEWSPPYQITCDKGLYRTKKRWQGWAMDVNVNAKNAFGGYTGFQPYLIMFESDGVRLEGTVHTSRGPFRWGLCRRETWTADNLAN